MKHHAGKAPDSPSATSPDHAAQTTPQAGAGVGNAATAEAVSTGAGRATRTQAGDDWQLHLWDFPVGQASLLGGHQAALRDLLTGATEEVDAGAYGWICEGIVGSASPEGDAGKNEALGMARARQVLSATTTAPAPSSAMPWCWSRAC